MTLNFTEEEAHGTESAAVWVDGERSAAAHEDSGGFIVQWAARWGLNPTDAMEAISEVQENSALHGGQRGTDQAREFLQRMAAGAAWFLNYDGDKQMAARCWLFRIGLHDISGCGRGTAVELARACSTQRHHVKKQTANKCIRSLEKFLNGMPQYRKLPPLPSQRSDAARTRMSEVTTEKWRQQA
jgi:hypothetical protein